MSNQNQNDQFTQNNYNIAYQLLGKGYSKLEITQILEQEGISSGDASTIINRVKILKAKNKEAKSIIKEGLPWFLGGIAFIFWLGKLVTYIVFGGIQLLEDGIC